MTAFWPYLLQVFSHGDLHLGQVLRSTDGAHQIGLVDFDRACRAAPAYDLATVAAHLVDGLPGDLDGAAAALDSLATGYGSRPAELRWYTATAIVRRAASPFRALRPDWPARAAAMIDAAGALAC